MLTFYVKQFRQQPPQHSSPKTPPPRPAPTPPLLPSVELQEQPQDTWQHNTDLSQAGLEIERPRSALHSGDFRDEKTQSQERGTATLSTSPPAPWSHISRLPRYDLGSQPNSLPYARPQQSRTRAISQSSLSSSFVLLPPTSPLVNASTNTEDVSPISPKLQLSESQDWSNRRHTFSPQSFQTYRTQGTSRIHTPPRGPPSLRKETTFPYQAHQPRRSISSISQLVPPSSSPLTPHLGPRRPSISSDTSPLHHAPMVGSYEESILRGRMSTTPSRPLNFVAQIGVLGRGNCKASLTCPPHVTIPFPAVFYSYGTGGPRFTENQPSPYVGMIDVENSLNPSEAHADQKSRSRRRRALSPEVQNGHTALSPNNTDSLMRQRKLEHQKRRSQSPRQMRAPPGGSYRIPPAGQLQIIIKNPHKTAVKLFLVPYDLSDMEPGTKTFIRQRSYSAGPIIDMPLSSRQNLGTDRPEASLSNSDDPRDRPVLRYLVHLNVCCLGRKGSERYYLYKSIRVVFANRVPDGKEKLRNEVQLPEPRYSAYKPLREPAATPQSNLAQELANRRRSAALDIQRLDAMDGITPSWNHAGTDVVDWSGFTRSIPSSSVPTFASDVNGSSKSRILAQPFTRHILETVDSRPGSRDLMDLDGSSNGWQSRHSSSNFSNKDAQPRSPISPLSRTTLESFLRNGHGGADSHDRVGDKATDSASMQFMRSASPSLGSGPGESLLSRRFRGLDTSGKMDEQSEN